MLPKEIHLEKGKKLFFASDFHLGVPGREESLAREKKITRWLEDIRQEAQAIFLLGDVFDFWFEYKKVIPKGFIRLQGKLAELSDSGIKIYMFHGNHDMWMFDYFKNELNIDIVPGTYTFSSGGKIFHVGHGDGLGPGDYSYKLLKRVFNNSLCQFLFGVLPPVIGMGLAHWWSKKSRIYNNNDLSKEDKIEMLHDYCLKKEGEAHHDYYIFGHRHKVIQKQIGSGSTYFNLGEWVHNSTFALFDGNNVALQTFSDRGITDPK